MIARDATAADYPCFARAFAELAIPDRVPDETKWREEIARDAFFVEDAGCVAGYGLVRPMRGAGHVVHVVSMPEARGKGVGCVIMEECARRLRASGCTEWLLNVKPDNAPAIGLYRRFGMTMAYATPSVSFELRWRDVERLPDDGARVDGRVLDASGGEDERVERAFALDAGQIASLRARGGVPIALFEQGDVVAFAGFEPRFPGSMPFRAKRPTLARALVLAMREHALPEHDYVRAVVENDAPLADAMRAGGAITTLEFVQMRGAIPRGGASEG
jgi:ribosomal protein S18 acetylase RimI-like enzyme